MLDLLQKATAKAAAEIKEVSKASGLQHLGHSALTLYYCQNYLAPVHCDADAAPALALQLSKEGCGFGDYDFAYAQYGIRFRTLEGSMW